MTYPEGNPVFNRAPVNLENKSMYTVQIVSACIEIKITRVKIEMKESGSAHGYKQCSMINSAKLSVS